GIFCSSIPALYLFSFGYPRMLGLMAGCLLACHSDDELRQMAKEIPLWPALFVYATIVFLQATHPVDYKLHYIALLLALLAIFIKIVFSDNVVSRIMSTRPFRFLGTISYSIYLWHIIVNGVLSVFVVGRLPAIYPRPIMAFAIFIFLF